MNLEIEWINAMANVGREEWDALTVAASPFLEWDWLRLMEESGSAAPEAGWQPRHILAREGGVLVGAAPLYLKVHSEGEFVFDYVWADVAYKLGLDYYPKLVGMSPFTPAGAYRFLLAPDLGPEGEAEVLGRMAGSVDKVCRALGLVACAFHYVDQDFMTTMEEHGFTAWAHPSFVWENKGFKTFDDHLAMFASNQRKNIRKERKALREAGIEVRCLEGEDIPQEFFPLMYRLYAEHNEKFGPLGCRYLTKEFFTGLGRSGRERLLFTAAYRAGRAEPVALAMLSYKGDTLYGRYWGADEEIRFLHFELCYYAPIEWAIARGLRRFDPGIGGAHKARRGFKAVPNYSLHRFYDGRMDYVLRTYIGEINAIELSEMDTLNRDVPFAENR